MHTTLVYSIYAAPVVLPLVVTRQCGYHGNCDSCNSTQETQVNYLSYISYDNSTYLPIEATTNDVVLVSSNPAYEEVTAMRLNLEYQDEQEQCICYSTPRYWASPLL